VEWASHWSQRWFRDEAGTDRFRIGSIEAGWATHVEAFLILHGVALEILGVVDRQGSPSARRWLKQRGLDRLIRSLLLRRAEVSGPSRAEMAAIVEIPTPSMSDPAVAVMRAAGRRGLIGTTDPRALPRVRAAGLRPRAVVATWSDERRLVREAERALRPAWSALARNPPEMRLDGTDVAERAIHRLRPLAQRSMPYLAPEASAIDSFLDAVSPQAIAIASDQHRIGRLTVSSARQRGVKTVVLQHGMPQARIGYLPVVADAVAAWSEASRSWFVNAGTDEGSVVVTGNPRTDGLGQLGLRADRRQCVLLVLSPNDAETNRSLVRTGLDALTRLPAARLTIKLHPGQGDWRFVRRLVSSHAERSRVEVRRHELLGPLLEAASVVVLNRSSVALEALAALRPVIVVRVGDAPTTAELDLASVRLPVADRPAELAAAIDDLSQPASAGDYFAHRTAEIEAAAGPTGGSAARIVELMARLGQGAASARSVPNTCPPRSRMSSRFG
jgi:hypothetical protein